MKIPDCYEAHRQAEAIAAEQDRRRAAFPKCDICGRSLYDDDTYLEKDNTRTCMHCAENLQESMIEDEAKRIEQYIKSLLRPTFNLISETEAE